MTDWRDLRRTTHDRRKVEGTILQRQDYSYEQPNPMRETPYIYGTPELIQAIDLANSIVATNTGIYMASVEQAETPTKPPKASFKREHPVWTPQRIFSLRKRMRMSQTEFGEELGFKGKYLKCTINRYEKGSREPSEQTIILMEQMESKLLLTNNQ